MAAKRSNYDKELADALRIQHNAAAIYQTTDGCWFTSKSKAEAHAAANNVKLKDTSECSQK